MHNGHQVVAIDDLSTGRLDNLQHLLPMQGFQFVRETIKNSQVLDRLTSQADIIIHLAAVVGDPFGQRDRGDAQWPTGP